VSLESQRSRFVENIYSFIVLGMMVGMGECEALWHATRTLIGNVLEIDLDLSATLTWYEQGLRNINNSTFFRFSTSKLQKHNNTSLKYNKKNLKLLL
jgi:hypothetical protein